MNCPHCEQPAVPYQVPNGVTLTLDRIHVCEKCRRQHHERLPGKWVKQGGYCADCGCETWRFVIHTKHGHAIPVWPDPAATYAYFYAEVNGGPTKVFQLYCTDCLPAKGTEPTHAIEGVLEPGQPHPVGMCIKHEPSFVKHAFYFGDDFGQFLFGPDFGPGGGWLADELRLDEVEIERLKSQWMTDRARAGGASEMTNAPPELTTD